jgi:replicative DNA helicase
MGDPDVLRDGETILRADDAERAVIGGLLLDPSLLPSLGDLTAGDFYLPAHAVIFATIREVVDEHGKADQLVVMEALRARGDLGRVGGAPYLHTCTSAIPTVANTGYYARFVKQAAMRRQINDLALRLRQVSYANDFDDALDMAIQLSFTLTTLADQTVSRDEDFLHDLHELGEFADAARDIPRRWVIPGLLAPMERVIVVASEGAGKSTWARSVAAMLGQGIHPLNPLVRIPPKRTLIVDLENPRDLLQMESRSLVDAARASGGWTSEQVYLWSRPGGVNLRKPADQALLDRLVSHVRPALICLGPLYKAALGGSDRGEQVAAETAAALDKIRAKHGCALWLEAHAPMEQQGERKLRPIDSGLWSRWPEFGIALRRDGGKTSRTFRLERFRGDRVRGRCWPDELSWGSRWPFEAKWDDGMPGALFDGNWEAA